MNKVVKGTRLTVAETADIYLEAGAALGSTILPTIKMSKEGKWMYGETELKELSYVADVPGILHGYACFGEGKLASEVLAPVGQQVPADKLPNRGEDWREIAVLQLTSRESGAIFQFRPTSRGGLNAIGSLLTQYGRRLKVSARNGLPVVELGHGTYRHKTLGNDVAYPIFHVREWRDVHGNGSTVAAEPAPAITHENLSEVSLAEELDDEIPF